MGIPNKQMSTEILIDTLRASESVKSLTSSIAASTSAWKAQEAQLRSANDNLGASQAKYEGLSRTIDIQKDKIALLKRGQDELDMSNKSNIEAYAKYQTQIDGATTKLMSLESQQSKAKTSLD